MGIQAYINSVAKEIMAGLSSVDEEILAAFIERHWES